MPLMQSDQRPVTTVQAASLGGQRGCKAVSAGSSKWLAVSRNSLIRTGTALLGLILLGVAVAGTLSAGRTAARSGLDHALTGAASSSASELREYFDRAQSLDLLLAHDLAFRNSSLAGDGAHP